MSAPVDETATTSTDAAETTATETATTAATGTETTAAAAAAQNVADLPDWAQKLIGDVRQEAAGHRTKAQTAADAAQREVTEKIAKALGLGNADDPAKLLEQATAAREAATAELVGLKREIAARDAAGKAQANPALLLDSATFRTELAKLDPADGTFAANLDRLIKTTVDAQPHLKAQARAAGANSVELTGGSGEPAQITDPKVIAAMSPEQIVAAEEKGQLRQYMAS